jgi:hypothetical protein
MRRSSACVSPVTTGATDSLDPLREPRPVLEAVLAREREPGIGTLELDAANLLVQEFPRQPGNALVEEARVVAADQLHGLRVTRAPGLEQLVCLPLVGAQRGPERQRGESHEDSSLFSNPPGVTSPRRRAYGNPPR